MCEADALGQAVFRAPSTPRCPRWPPSLCILCIHWQIIHILCIKIPIRCIFFGVVRIVWAGENRENLSGALKTATPLVAFATAAVALVLRAALVHTGAIVYEGGVSQREHRLPRRTKRLYRAAERRQPLSGIETALMSLVLMGERVATPVSPSVSVTPVAVHAITNKNLGGGQPTEPARAS